MTRTLKRSLIEFKEHWKSYTFQSLLATFVVFLVLLALNIKRDAVIIASIGSTAFIVFAMPKSRAATSRAVIGGQIVGMISGYIASLIPHAPFLHEFINTSLICSLAVGLSIFIMVVLDTEHPPAAGTALGVSVLGFSWNVTVTLLASIIVLSLIHVLAKNRLRDLT